MTTSSPPPPATAPTTGVVDAYTHYAPLALTSYLQDECNDGKPLVFAKLFDRIPLLTDMPARLAFMDAHHIDTHVLVPLPWLEVVPGCHSNKEKALEACKRANVEMAAVADAHPTRIFGVALLPTGHLKEEKKQEGGAEGETEGGSDILIEAYTHAVDVCGLDGVALFVGPLSAPLDHPGFEPLWKQCQEQGVPVWVHPNRPQFYPDYEAYRGKGGSLHQIWNTLGWVYDTSVAMVHMVMAGVFQRYPDLKVVTHHHGGMIPFFTDRFTTQSQNFDDTEGLALLQDMKKFYCDTATFGVAPLNIRQALEFFEPGRVLFGTDTPMDMAAPGSFIEASKEGVLKSGVSPETMTKVWSENFWAMMQKRVESKGGRGGGKAGGGKKRKERTDNEEASLSHP